MPGLATKRSNLNRLRKALGRSPQVNARSGPASPGNAPGSATGSGGLAQGPRAIRQTDPATVSLIGGILLDALDGSLACIDGTQQGAGSLLREVLAEDGADVMVVGGTLTYTQALRVACAKKLLLVNCTVNFDAAAAAGLFTMPANTCLNLCLINSTINVTGAAGAAWASLVSGPIDSIQVAIEADDNSTINVTVPAGPAVVIHTAQGLLPGGDLASVTIEGGTIALSGTEGGLIWTSNAAVPAADRHSYVATLIRDAVFTGIIFLQTKKMYCSTVTGSFTAGQVPALRVTVECQSSRFEIDGVRDGSTPAPTPSTPAMVSLDTVEEGTHSEVEVVVTFDNAAAGTPGQTVFAATAGGAVPNGKVEAVRVAQIDNNVVRTNADAVEIDAQRVENFALETTSGGAVAPVNTNIDALYVSADLDISGDVSIEADEVAALTLNDSAVATALAHTVTASRIGDFYAVGDGANPSTVTFAALNPGAPGTVAWQADNLVCDDGILPVLTGVDNKVTRVGTLAVATAGGNIDAFVDATPQTLYIDTLTSLVPGTANILGTAAGVGASALSAIGTVINSGDFAAVIAAVTAARVGASIA